MIGVISREDQKPVVEEFFELFKTPWSPCSDGREYDVVISSDPGASFPPAKLVLVFSPDPGPMNDRNGIKVHSCQGGGDIAQDDSAIPVYRRLGTFEGSKKPFLFTQSGQTVGFSVDLSNQRILCIGYDLFDEVEYLLRRGQPAQRAMVPTLEKHISLLRQWILGAGIPLVEIPPSPYGYDFIACLTHDIDFMGIRDHKFDHSMLGFVYRALIPKYLKGLDRKTALSRYLKNIRALLSLPLVHMGLLPDFWYPLDRYPEVEKGLKSTFFFIPFRDRAGEPPNGRTAEYRASRYDVNRFEEPIRGLKARGHEVGLHGIDAWRGPEQGRTELDVIRRITGDEKIGVRMHWLYYTEKTPKHLEEAGINYDSTLGYNETVGFRSGTAQVFRLPGTSRLFELPLLVQDTAMFYPDRMEMSESRAVDLCGRLIGKMKTHGGAFTINWHDRSLAPERNWEVPYLAILGKLRKERTWFATAGEAVAWFEKRRACRFWDSVTFDSTQKVHLRAADAGNGPPLAFRHHRPGDPSSRESRFQDTRVDIPSAVPEDLPVG
jgi:peptidoglycan/xylan/chitin deacetylase (PgdA/CDA1 family)